MLGYDLSQQVGLFDRLGSRTSRASRWLEQPRWRTLLAAAGLALALGGAHFAWRRRRARGRADDGRGPRDDRAQAIASGLYEMLDRAMIQLGMTRALATPPLRHAERLVESQHPLAAEILSLTERYLEARFGQRHLTTAERRQFEARVRRLHLAASAVVLDGDEFSTDELRA